MDGGRNDNGSGDNQGNGNQENDNQENDGGNNLLIVIGNVGTIIEIINGIMNQINAPQAITFENTSYANLFKYMKRGDMSWLKYFEHFPSVYNALREIFVEKPKMITIPNYVVREASKNIPNILG